jgi:hypothetical protein
MASATRAGVRPQRALLRRGRIQGEPIRLRHLHGLTPAANDCRSLIRTCYRIILSLSIEHSISFVSLRGDLGAQRRHQPRHRFSVLPARWRLAGRLWRWEKAHGAAARVFPPVRLPIPGSPGLARRCTRGPPRPPGRPCRAGRSSACAGRTRAPGAGRSPPRRPRPSPARATHSPDWSGLCRLGPRRPESWRRAHG